ncbi:transcriptional regulator [Desulfosarcina ovata subsp. ovata]|uniref:Transcriptional regulator n=2 Tax=Desulfosarcina ovata TaxID=83564 RepID=A0A5K8ADN6_9BACT|nr:transcriptional regulator [Desulfosarcina ovata subsp. ovata]
MSNCGVMVRRADCEALFDQILEPVGIMDGHFRIIRYNASGYGFIAKKPEEVIGKRCHDVFGLGTPCSCCALHEAYRTRQISTVEKYFSEIDSWFLVTAYPIVDGNGRITRVFQHYRDITEDKQRELRLLILERALNHSIDGIAVANMEGENQFVNPAWAQIHGYRVEEMVGKNLYSFHPEKQLRENVIPFFNTVLEKGCHRGESEHTKKDGTLFATYMMASIIKGRAGESIGFVGTIRDISELKQAQRELEKYRDHLEELVEARTHELQAKNEALSIALSQIRKLKEQLEKDNIQLREQINHEQNFEEIIGRSDPLKYVLYKIGDVAPTDATTLILGQSGTGKELVARAIHKNSARSSRPMVKVDCSALPAELIESELFGHEKGAFSGAHQSRKGRFEIANGSTIFLDEIGELEPGLQSKFLRVLEYGEFERLGSSKTLRTDVRIIAATNRNLQEEVAKGRFREDLWFRLNVFTLTVPPLKDRRDDIPLLVESFVAKFNRKHGKTITKIPKKTMNALMAYHWPGNIRELSNLIEAAIIVSRDDVLRTADLPDFRRDNADKQFPTMAEMENRHIVRALEACGWQIEGNKGAARRLDLNPGTLRGRMRKLGIKRPQR